MSSGLEFDEDMTDPLADVSRMLLSMRDMAAFAAEKPLQAEPGSRWQYSSGTTNVLSGALRDDLGDDAYHRFPRKILFERLGMTSAVLETDAAGTFVGSSFMYATARDLGQHGAMAGCESAFDDGAWS